MLELVEICQPRYATATERSQTRGRSFPLPLQKHVSAGCRVTEGKEPTFEVYPQKRWIRLPILKYATLEEPRCCSLVMDTAGNIVIC